MASTGTIHVQTWDRNNYIDTTRWRNWDRTDPERSNEFMEWAQIESRSVPYASGNIISVERFSGGVTLIEVAADDDRITSLTFMASSKPPCWPDRVEL